MKLKFLCIVCLVWFIVEFARGLVVRSSYLFGAKVAAIAFGIVQYRSYITLVGENVMHQCM